MWFLLGVALGTGAAAAGWWLWLWRNRPERTAWVVFRTAVGHATAAVLAVFALLYGLRAAGSGFPVPAEILFLVPLGVGATALVGAVVALFTSRGRAAWMPGVGAVAAISCLLCIAAAFPLHAAT